MTVARGSTAPHPKAYFRKFPEIPESLLLVRATGADHNEARGRQTRRDVTTRLKAMCRTAQTDGGDRGTLGEVTLCRHSNPAS